MKRSENKEFFRHLYDMSLLETMEFIFCDDIVVDYRDTMIGIVDRNHDYFIAWHGVAGKC
ncbi:hypothetical protein LCGC14_1981860 [marine sediment metagenome]|uniref:Uncharacterized protein n=1 Tax=marine sediment metagenome TaxID=412755 RepID=A0A0F9F8K1_9ZZZZ